MVFLSLVPLTLEFRYSDLEFCRSHFTKSCPQILGLSLAFWTQVFILLLDPGLYFTIRSSCFDSAQPLLSLDRCSNTQPSSERS